LKHKDQLKIGPIGFAVVLLTDGAFNRPTPAPPTKTLTGKQPVKVTDNTKIPPKNDTPAPENEAAKGPAANGPATDDDEVAAMLMSLQDDGDGNTASGLIPDGSTVFDMPMPGAPGSQPAEKKLTEAEKEKEKAKLHQGNTSSAAKSILEKMMRRPRT
jgi:hypothetical protein